MDDHCVRCGSELDPLDDGAVIRAVHRTPTREGSPTEYLREKFYTDLTTYAVCSRCWPIVELALRINK